MPYLAPSYDPWVVALSVAIAGFASFVALDLADRVHHGGRLALKWWACGSVAMGTGIWSMHFIGMLAFSIPVELGYTPLFTALSWLAAIIVSAIGLGVAGQNELSWQRLAVGSATMGAGIFAMHYLGMAALDMAPGIVWDIRLVAASFAIAVVASGAALVIFFWLRRIGEQGALRWRLLAAAAMGVAISGMHYTGMAAASFPAGSICLSAGAISGHNLNELIGLAAFLLLALTLMTSMFDARMQSQAARLAASLREANVGLERERERFRALTQLSSDWFWEQDKDLRFTTISNNFGNNTGHVSETFVGRLRWECEWADLEDDSWQRHREQLERRETFHEFIAHRLDAQGRHQTVSLSGAPVYDDRGEFAGYRGVGRDITDRRQQERRETLQHVVTRLLAESTSTALAMPDIIRAVCRACEWSGGFFMSGGVAEGGMHCRQLWAEDAAVATFEGLAGCTAAPEQDRIAAEAGLGGRFACPVRAGEHLFGILDFRFPGHLQADAATLEVMEGLGLQIGQSIARWEAEADVRNERELLAQRVTERTHALIEANAELERAKLGAETASLAKSAFLAAMSHEIRTPMNGVIGMIEVLAQTNLAEDQADAVRTISASAFSLLRLIDDVLDFSKIEAGRLEIERTPVALTELVESVCDLLVPEAANRGVELRLFIDPELPEHVWSDATRLRQTLNNLVGNAVKFSGGRPDKPGRVAVRVERAACAAERLVLRVADNGIGMDKATLTHLFKPFVQAEASTTRRFGGTGLGLVICKRLVLLLGGEIEVASEAGVGSTFTVTLPFEAATGPASRPAPDLHGVDCVVVAAPGLADEDLRVYLEHAGASVHVASGADAAARLAASLGGGAVVIQGVAAGMAALRTALAPFSANSALRHVMLVSGAAAPAPTALPAGVTLADAGLRRAAFLHAVAAGIRTAAPGDQATAASAHHERRVAPSITQARAESSLVLIAEDDPINQKVILKQLALLGHAGEVASNGAEALRLWQEGGHALLLSDLHMPELDGYGLAGAIRAREASLGGAGRLPILALTANALREEARRVRAAGMDEYLTKPIQLAALGAALARWLPRRSSAAAPMEACPPQGPAVDVAVLQSLVGDDPRTVDEFLAEFLLVARAQAAEVDAACQAEDHRQVGAIAHKLKASSRSIGALALGDLCAELENASRTAGRSEMSVHRTRFEHAMRDVEACIVDLLGVQAA